MQILSGVLAAIVAMLIVWNWKKRRRTSVRLSGAELAGDWLGGRFEEMGNSFQLLGELLAKEPDSMREELESRFWKRQLAESRQAVAEQYLELSRRMEDWKQELACTQDVTAEWRKKRKGILRTMGLELYQVLLFQQGRQKEVCMTIRTEGRLVNSRELAEAVDGLGGVHWHLTPGEPAILTGKMHQVLLEAEPGVTMHFGVTRQTRHGEAISGDGFTQQRLPRGRIVMALCDGMGSGPVAFRESGEALELLEHLLDAGYSAESAARLVHTSLLLGESRERHPVALDVCELDLYQRTGHLTKLGGVCSFLKRDGQVQRLEAEALPAGALVESDPGECFFHFREGDLLVMVTDGVLDAFPGLQKEEHFALLLSMAEETDAMQLASWLSEQIKKKSAEASDDRTILVACAGGSRRESGRKS